MRNNIYKILSENGDLYNEYQYDNEAEYELMIMSNADTIFGSQGIYFDIKKKLGKSKEGAAIPDGYYLDLKFHDDPLKNIDQLLDTLIFNKEVAVIIVINETSEQLTRVLLKIKISADIIEAQSFVCNGKHFTAFYLFKTMCSMHLLNQPI